MGDYFNHKGRTVYVPDKNEELTQNVLQNYFRQALNATGGARKLSDNDLLNLLEQVIKEFE